MTLTPEAYEKLKQNMPKLATYRRLIMESAERQGDQAVAVWKCLRGVWFGAPTVMTAAGAARTLGLPVSTVQGVINRTMREVSPAWHASPEYAALPDAIASC